MLSPGRLFDETSTSKHYSEHTSTARNVLILKLFRLIILDGISASETEALWLEFCCWKPLNVMIFMMFLINKKLRKLKMSVSFRRHAQWKITNEKKRTFRWKKDGDSPHTERKRELIEKKNNNSSEQSFACFFFISFRWWWARIYLKRFRVDSRFDVIDAYNGVRACVRDECGVRANSSVTST